MRCMPHVQDMQLRDAHAGAAGAEQRVDFEDYSEHVRPGAACFPGEVGIVLLGASVCAGPALSPWAEETAIPARLE